MLISFETDAQQQVDNVLKFDLQHWLCTATHQRQLMTLNWHNYPLLSTTDEIKLFWQAIKNTVFVF